MADDTPPADVYNGKASYSYVDNGGHGANDQWGYENPLHTTQVSTLAAELQERQQDAFAWISFDSATFAGSSTLPDADDHRSHLFRHAPNKVTADGKQRTNVPALQSFVFASTEDYTVSDSHVTSSLLPSWVHTAQRFNENGFNENGEGAEESEDTGADEHTDFGTNNRIIASNFAPFVAGQHQGTAESNEAAEPITALYAEGFTAAEAGTSLVSAVSLGSESVPMRRHRVLRSPVWIFFTIPESSVRIPWTLCKLCKTKFRYHSSTSALSKHLLAMHDVDIDLVRQDMNVRNALIELYKEQLQSEPDDTSTISKTENVYAAVTTFLLSMGSVSLVDDRSFRALLNVLDKHCEIPTFSELYASLDEARVIERASVKVHLQPVPQIAISAEVWIAENGNTLVEVSAYFQSGPALVTKTMGANLVRYPGNADAIADALLETLDAYEIVNKVVALTVNSASTVQEAIALLMHKLGNHHAQRFTTVPCIGFAITTTVQTALASVAAISELLAKCRACAIFFQTYPHHLDALNEAQKGHANEPLAPRTIPNDDCRHWISVARMLQLMESLATGLDLYVATLESNSNETYYMHAKIACLRFSHWERQLMREVQVLLEPFVQAAVLLTRQSACPISMILPVVSILISRLEALKESIHVPAANHFRSQLLKISSYKELTTANEMTLKVATALDPAVCRLADEKAVLHIRQLISREPAAAFGCILGADNGGTFAQSEHFAVPTDEYITFRQTASLEFALSTISPAVYWHENKNRFPRLYSIAAPLFVIPATCAARLFANDRDNHTRRRAHQSVACADIFTMLRPVQGGATNS